MDLEKSIGANLIAETTKTLFQPAAAGNVAGFRTQEQVGGQGLQVETHPHQLGPSAHPVLGIGRQAR